MTLEELSKSKLQPLPRISPSKFMSLQVCPLREIWTANNKPELLPGSPAAYLGTVIHKLIEQGTHGRINNESEMITCWATMIKDIEKDMQNKELARNFVPLELNANNYEVKKNMAFNIVRSLFGKTSTTTGIYKEKKLETEVWVETKDKKIGGKIDLVIHGDKGVEIFDYKTGAIVDSLDDESSIKMEYQQQLKIYAALYFSFFDVWPIRLVLIGLDQKEYEVLFNNDECLRILNDATRMLDELNELIKAGQSYESFARPSPKACKYCFCRPACKVYWENRQETEEWPADIRGIVKEKKILGNGSIKLILDCGGREVVIRGLSDEKHKFLKKELSNVMFCNLGQDSGSGFFIEKPMTTGYKL